MLWPRQLFRAMRERVFGQSFDLRENALNLVRAFASAAFSPWTTV
jgi:hypothetical protein